MQLSVSFFSPPKQIRSHQAVHRIALLAHFLLQFVQIDIMIFSDLKVASIPSLLKWDNNSPVLLIIPINRMYGLIFEIRSHIS